MFGTLFGFGGRLSREGFIEALFSIVLIDVALVLGLKYVEAYGLPWGYGPGSRFASGLVLAAPLAIVGFTLWSLLAVAIKRCHDRSRPGVLLLLLLAPVVGWLWLFVDLTLLAGVKGRNRYGRAPHSRETAPLLWSQSESAAALAAPNPPPGPQAEPQIGPQSKPQAQPAEAAEAPEAQGGEDRSPAARPAADQGRAGGGQAVPSFVQQWATVYYDPTPPKREGGALDAGGSSADPAPEQAPAHA